MGCLGLAIGNRASTWLHSLSGHGPLNLPNNKFFSLAISWLCATKELFRQNYAWINLSRSYFGEFDPLKDFDLLLGASKLNLRIVEAPIRYHDWKYKEINTRRFAHHWLLLKMVIYAFFKLKAVRCLGKFPSATGRSSSHLMQIESHTHVRLSTVVVHINVN